MPYSDSAPKTAHGRTAFIVPIVVLVSLALAGVAWVKLTPRQNDAEAKASAPKKYSVDPSPEKQRARDEFIKNLISEQVFEKVDRPLTRPHVYVADAWNLMDEDEKGKALGAVLAYYYVKDARADVVIIRDATTGERIGIFSENGLELD